MKCFLFFSLFQVVHTMLVFHIVVLCDEPDQFPPSAITAVTRLKYSKDSSVVNSAGVATVGTWVRIQVTMGTWCERELLAFILAPTIQASLRLRRSVK